MRGREKWLEREGEEETRAFEEFLEKVWSL